MKLPELLAFVDLAQTGNFRATARKLQLSPSTLTAQIQSLERDLGARLVVRSRRGCTLTPAGADALPLAKSLAGLAGRLHSLFREPRLSVAASSNIGTYLLPPLCRRFQETAAFLPELTVADNPACAERVRDGRVDCAVLEWWIPTPGFSAVIWGRESLVAIAPPHHRWTRRERLLAADLEEEPLLGGESGSGTGTVLKRALGDRAGRLRISMRLGSTEAVKQAVMNGLGVSVVMASAVRNEVAAGRLWAAPLADTPLFKELHAVCRDDWRPGQAPRLFLDFLSSAGRDYGR